MIFERVNHFMHSPLFMFNLSIQTAKSRLSSFFKETELYLLDDFITESDKYNCVWVERDGGIEALVIYRQDDCQLIIQDYLYDQGEKFSLYVLCTLIDDFRLKYNAMPKIIFNVNKKFVYDNRDLLSSFYGPVNYNKKLIDFRLHVVEPEAQLADMCAKYLIYQLVLYLNS